MMRREPVPPGLGSWPEAAGVAFRVWAPNASAVAVRLVDGALAGQEAAMAAEPGGYWSAEVAGAAVGDGYLYMVTWEGRAPGTDRSLCAAGDQFRRSRSDHYPLAA
jgi:1,4-alpha-glucan branching enzyme